MIQQTVLITGVSRGIGLATAKKFLDQGWQVVGTSTSGILSASLLGSIQVFALDLGNEKSIASCTTAIKNR